MTSHNGPDHARVLRMIDFTVLDDTQKPFKVSLGLALIR